MKEKIRKKGCIILLLMLQILQLIGNFVQVEANIKEGGRILLEKAHECDSLLEYWMEEEQRWSYKVIWYVYYQNQEDGKKYPAFCVEPSKDGVGVKYESYHATISKEHDNRIWRILNKGYMGSNYQEWNLECDDDFYSATKVALHALVTGIAPKDKHTIGNRSVDGNTVEEISRRAKKVLEVAQTLYEYGIYGIETYEEPKIKIAKQGEKEMKTINNHVYYVQNYQVTTNQYLKSYEISIQNFPKGTKIFNSKFQEVKQLQEASFQIAIPIQEIKQNINGNIYIQNAQIKTNPIFYCQSEIESAQNYITYMSGYETASTHTTFNLQANTSSLSIQKIDKETKKPIANVTFQIKDEQGNIIAETTTNEKGVAMFTNMIAQKVKIKEVEVPKPYKLSNEEKEVVLEWEKTTSITFENERKKGNLKIVKVDEENSAIPLEGVEFEILNEKGDVIKRVVTNEKGMAFVTNLEVGSYQIREIKTKEEYILKQELVTIKVENEKTKMLQIENQKIKGQIKIQKISEDDNKINGKPKGTPIENVVFEIRKESGELVEILTTNQEGIAISKELEKGIYQVKEVESNQDYIINKEEFWIEITQNEKIEEITVTNLSKQPELPKLPRTGF